MLLGRLIIKIKLKLPIIVMTDGYHHRSSDMKRLTREYYDNFLPIDLTPEMD